VIIPDRFRILRLPGADPEPWEHGVERPVARAVPRASLIEHAVWRAFHLGNLVIVPVGALANLNMWADGRQTAGEALGAAACMAVGFACSWMALRAGRRAKRP
jgi:hypothetical protein